MSSTQLPAPGKPYIVITQDALSALKTMPDGMLNACVTSPPYFGLRDYKADGQIGAGQTLSEYIGSLVQVFRQVRRVLRDDGTLWLNLGDSYTNAGKWGGKTGGKHAIALHGESAGRAKRDTGGLKPKDLIGVPWRVAFALQDDGWYLRSDIVWHKPNAMPESVTDRPTRSHEYIFLLSKRPLYYYNHEAIKEPLLCPGAKGMRFGGGKYPGSASSGASGTYSGNVYDASAVASGRNKRDVWTVPTRPLPAAHFATYPPNLIRPCVLAGCPPGGVVLDPFCGAGTTGVVCVQEGRRFVGVELNPEYAGGIAVPRIEAAVRASVKAVKYVTGSLFD